MAHAAADPIPKEVFGKTADGTTVDIYTLRNSKGAEARIINYGGIIVSLKVPDRDGKMGDVELGFDNLNDYLNRNPFFGCMVGRYGNRIGNAKFTLGGKQYTLAANNGPNSLHGGLKGFDKKLWAARSFQGDKGPSLELKYLSADGEEGFPGNLSVTATYTMTEDNAMQLEYVATTDKETVVNLTQHSYFNLSGKGSVLDYELMIPADKFTPADKTQIPTGEIKSVEGTPFDFRKPTKIGARINNDDEQLKFGSGYDHNWVVTKPAGQLALLARVYDPASGRVLEAFSTEPGFQFYTANHMSNVTGKGGAIYKAREAFCIEPQHYPDSPNKPNFPSAALKPGETYRNTIIYKFSVKK
jgi:aldose 1-epimerase